MTYYLVESKFEGDLTVRLFDGTDELVEFLRGNIEHGIYTGDNTFDTVYKHHEGGKLEKLAVKHVGTSEDTENDYSHYGYVVQSNTGSPQGEVVEATFSVRIDGRA